MSSPRNTDLRRTTLHAVEVSREIVIDSLFLTKTLMHAIRNNLPVELSLAQVDPVDDDDDSPLETLIAAPRQMPRWRAHRAVMVLVACALLLAVSVGGLLMHNSLMKRDRATAIQSAHSIVMGAQDVDLNRPSILLDAATKRLAAQDLELAASIAEPIWNRRVMPERSGQILAEALLAQGEYKRARDVAREVLVINPERTRIIEIFNASVVRDEGFKSPAEPLDLDDYQVELTRAPGVLLLEHDGESYELTLATTENPAEWEDPIAARRFCEILKCRFDLPVAQSVSVDAESLALRISTMDRDDEFVSTQGRVPGSLVNVSVRSMARFPIERTRAWRPLLDVSTPLGNEPAAESLPSMRKERRAWKKLKPQLKEQSAMELAEGLSSLLIFDFMANNWERFERKRRKWGSNLRVADGNLVAINNVGAFKERGSKRVRGRMKWAERLSGTTVASALAIDFDRIGPSLFETAGKSRDAKIRALKRQQKRLAKRVSRLEEVHGSDVVMVFP